MILLMGITQLIMTSFPGSRIYRYLMTGLIGFILIVLAFGYMTGDSTHSGAYQDSGLNSSSQKSGNYKWMTTPLTDISSKKTITINDLALSGKTVIIHTFALWCPSCTIQLGETTRLQYDYPGQYTMLAIDIDPHDSEEKVLEHVQTYAFDGSFCLAPASLSREMVRDLGSGVTLSLPQTIIIRNGQVELLGGGIIPESDLHERLSSS